MTKTLLSLALLAALPAAWAADPAPRAEPGAKPSPAPLDEVQAAAARKELGELRTQIGDLSRRMAELSVKLGDTGPRAYAFRYLNDPDRAMVGVVLSATPQGARIDALTPDSPAERAGLRSGDVITEIDGKALAKGATDAALVDARTRLGDLRDGQDVRIGYLRDGKPGKAVTLKAQRREAQNWPRLFVDVDANVEAARALAEADADAQGHVIEARHATARAEADAGRALADAQRAIRRVEISRIDAARDSSWWGINLASLNPELGHYFGADRGVLVLSTRDGTAAGLKAGDVIRKVGGEQVERPEDALRALRAHPKGSEVTLDLLRERKALALEVKVPEYTSMFSATLAPQPPLPPLPPAPPSAVAPEAPPAPAAPPAAPKPPSPPDASAPLAPKDANMPTPRMALEGDRLGSIALWGGRVKGHLGVGDATCLRVMTYELRGDGKPIYVARGGKEFLACPETPFPKESYRLGEFATFAGHVGEVYTESRRLGDMPILQVSDTKFWKPMPEFNGSPPTTGMQSLQGFPQAPVSMPGPSLQRY
ncbi:PDZ domain-containing protein [Dokdonella sp. MW10]|uniref:PDZ domain-containing protein n=1 Tax=Dokdonella sp. MW10 TaxID=2992926 RepID=UPI003F80CC84